MTILYHYTCVHAAEKIAAAGRLVGHPHKHLPQIAPLIWLSNLPIVGEPMDVERVALGMPHQPEAEAQGCDRFSHRVTVATRGQVFHWPRWSRRNLETAQRQAIELNGPGILPAHWWVGFRDLPVLAVQPTGEPLVWVAGEPLLDLSVFFEDTPTLLGEEVSTHGPAEPVRHRPGRARAAGRRVHGNARSGTRRR
jgi:hypothetical protein